MIRQVVMRLRDTFGLGRSTPDELATLDESTAYNRAFEMFDEDEDGILSYREFITCVRKLDLGLSDTQVYELMRAADTKQDGTISLSEFKAWLGRCVGGDDATLQSTDSRRWAHSSSFSQRSLSSSKLRVDSNTRIAGWLMKRGAGNYDLSLSNFFGGRDYRRRFFVLHGTELSYFSQRPRGATAALGAAEFGSDPAPASVSADTDTDASVAAEAAAAIADSDADADLGSSEWMRINVSGRTGFIELARVSRVVDIGDEVKASTDLQVALGDSESFNFDSLDNSNANLRFELHTPDRVWQLAAETEDARVRWVSALRAGIKASQWLLQGWLQKRGAGFSGSAAAQKTMSLYNAMHGEEATQLQSNRQLTSDEAALDSSAFKSAPSSGTPDLGGATTSGVLGRSLSSRAPRTSSRDSARAGSNRTWKDKIKRVTSDIGHSHNFKRRWFAFNAAQRRLQVSQEIVSPFPPFLHNALFP